MPSIAVITATFNARDHIEGLASSLLQQTDQDFDWIVADGASTDGTVEYLQGLQSPQLTISVKEDFGIYDALNRAIKLSNADYYVVAGADDEFFPEAIQEFKQAAAESNSDVIVFDVMYGKCRIQPRKRPIWLAGHKALVSEHAVGTLFKRSLHNRLGFYSKQYHIAADHDFILRCKFSNATFVSVNTLAGINATDGLSSRERTTSILESFHVQIKHYHFHTQLLILFFRLLLYKNTHSKPNK